MTPSQSRQATPEQSSPAVGAGPVQTDSPLTWQAPLPTTSTSAEYTHFYWAALFFGVWLLFLLWLAWR
ncbi:MAG: hypothetical protein SFX18_06080 [Pirellulales bacterium]|nr:hypothetical protein [Pirellulales bacterium]